MIFTIGEALLDVIFENNQPRTARPGGSTLNTSVSLGRLGIPVSFISEWGNDRIGNIIDTFLKENNVFTNYVYRYKDAQTILAMAFLNEQKDASYMFYKEFPKKRLNIILPEIKENDIVLFSSFFAINTDVRPALLKIIKKAREAGAILIYDPNFRNSHSDNMDILSDMISENISLVDIVRGSDADFFNVFKLKNSEETYKKIKEKGCNNLIYTASNNGVFVHSNNYKKQYSVPVIKPLSTIGAGDNFNAGIIYSLKTNNILKSEINNITKENWNKIVQNGINFAQEVCMHMDNYISSEFVKNYLNQ